MDKKRGNIYSKKALSPVITTILLVLLAIILAAIIYLWARGFTKDTLVKFDEPIERACDKISFEIGSSATSLLITNKADVPIYAIKIMTTSDSSSSSAERIDQTINPGESKVIAVSGGVNSGDKIIPILLGESKNKEVLEYECPKSYWITVD